MGRRSIQIRGLELATLRNSRGMRQEDLAEQVGCAKRTIENAESGRPVSATTVQKIAAALGVPVSAILAKVKEPMLSASYFKRKLDDRSFN